MSYHFNMGSHESVISNTKGDVYNMGPDIVITDEQIFSRVQNMMNHLNQTAELQRLSKENGLDVKNAFDLSDENKEKYAVASVSLMLAKRAGDPKYDLLVRTGLQKRELKADIINSYKSEAKQLLNKVENRMTDGV